MRLHFGVLFSKTKTRLCMKFLNKLCSDKRGKENEIIVCFLLNLPKNLFSIWKYQLENLKYENIKKLVVDW